MSKTKILLTCRYAPMVYLGLNEEKLTAWVKYSGRCRVVAPGYLRLVKYYDWNGYSDKTSIK